MTRSGALVGLSGESGLAPLMSVELITLGISAHEPDPAPMDDSTPPASSWTASPTAKEKNVVQRAVTALLDELAPETVVKRGGRISLPVEQHRTPNGCVLQAPKAAVSVSWFREAADDALFGELHIVVWQGIVSRRGSPKHPEGATVIKELVLRPVERPRDECVWRAADGSTYDTRALAAHCLALLQEQIGELRSPDAVE